MTEAELEKLMAEVTASLPGRHKPNLVLMTVSDEALWKLIDAITTLRAQLAAETARADRAEAERAAQIEADAGICDEMLGKIWDDEAYDCAAAIRAQPHDRTALDAAIRAAKVEAWKEAAAAIAEFETPMTENCALGHEDAYRAILALIKKNET